LRKVDEARLTAGSAKASTIAALSLAMMFAGVPTQLFAKQQQNSLEGMEHLFTRPINPPRKPGQAAASFPHLPLEEARH